MELVPNRQPPAHARHRSKRRALLIVLGALVALVIVARLVLDPIAARFTRRALDKMDGLTATFSAVHVGVFPPSYEIKKFKLIEEPAGRWDEPLIYAERAEVGLLWRKLLSGQVVAKALIIEPKLVAVRRHEKKAEKGADIGQQLENAAPVKMDRLEVVDGELLIAQGKGKKAPQLWLHNIDLVAQNLATRKTMMDEKPASLKMRGRVQRSGALAVDAKMDPWTPKPTFSAEAALEKLDVRELYAFLAKNAELKTESGEINLYAQMNARDGVLKGGVKPVLKDIEVGSKDDDLGNKLKAFFADAAIDVLSDDNEGRDAIATVIPLRGTLDKPDTQLVPTVLGVVRNAFVVGLRSGFAGLPPKTAEEKEGVLKQAWQALKRDEGPPEAQPKNQEEN